MKLQSKNCAVRTNLKMKAGGGGEGGAYECLKE